MLQHNPEIYYSLISLQYTLRTAPVTVPTLTNLQHLSGCNLSPPQSSIRTSKHNYLDSRGRREKDYGSISRQMQALLRNTTF